MKFYIEQETRYNPSDVFVVHPEQPITTFWVWVDEETERYYSRTCFSFHGTLEEAKREIEKIKNIFPPKDETLICFERDGTCVLRQTILDRCDYQIKNIFNVYKNHRNIGKYEKEHLAIQAFYESLLKKDEIKKESSIVYIETI